MCVDEEHQHRLTLTGEILVRSCLQEKHLGTRKITHDGDLDGAQGRKAVRQHFVGFESSKANKKTYTAIITNIVIYAHECELL